MIFLVVANNHKMSQHATFSIVDDKDCINGNQVGIYGILKLCTQQTPTDLYP